MRARKRERKGEQWQIGTESGAPIAPGRSVRVARALNGNGHGGGGGKNGKISNLNRSDQSRR